MDRTAGPASLDMAAKRGCPAQFDRAHHATFDATKMAGARLNIDKAMTAKDISHL